MEEYLQSARETRVTRQASTAGQRGLGHSNEGYHHHQQQQQLQQHQHQLHDQGVTRGDKEEEELGGEAPTGVEPEEDEFVGRTFDRRAVSQVGASGSGDVPPPKPARLRKHYQPCTIPLRRDRTNVLASDPDEEPVVKEEDDVPVSGG